MTSAKREKRRFCECRLYGGVILSTVDQFSIAKLDAFDDVAEPIGAIKAAQ